MNNRRHILNKKIPSSFGIVGLVVALVTITWLSGNAILFGTKAANGNIPRQVQISNISASSFTVSYTTDEFAIGTISYGTDEKLGKVGLDDRDQQGGNPVSHRVHHITVKQLTPATKYFFTITSGDRTFSNGNAQYTVTTAPPLNQSPANQAPATGSVGLEDGTIPTEGLVYLSSNDSQLLSTLLKPDGGYIIPLNTILTKNLSSLLTFTPDSILHLNVTNGVLQSTISLLANQTNPVPRIILSKNYNFTADDAVIEAAAQPVASDSAGFPTPSIAVSEVTSPEITSPEEDEVFQDNQPLFAGKAVPDAPVAISIIQEETPDEELTTTMQSDTNGNWEYRPETPLNPGTYTFTLASADSSGDTQTITNTFVVNASGSQFTEPSVSPEPSFDVTPSASPTAIIEPTITPTLTPTVVTPTISPTIASGSGMITQPPIPQSGSEMVFIGFAAVFVSIAIGTLFFFFI